MENLQSLENTTDDLKKQMWNLSKNVIPELKEKIENSNTDNLETKLTELENQISEITNTVIPNLEEKIAANENSSAATSEWTTVYDKDSEDAALNWGYTSGLMASIGLVSNSIDFTPYKFIRVYYYKATLISHHDFDIEAVRDVTSYIPYFTCLLFDASILMLTGLSLGLKYDETTGQRHLYIGRGRTWAFKTNTYNSSTDLSSSSNCYIFKVQVKS